MHSGIAYFISIALDKNAHSSIAYNTPQSIMSSRTPRCSPTEAEVDILGGDFGRPTETVVATSSTDTPQKVVG